VDQEIHRRAKEIARDKDGCDASVTDLEVGRVKAVLRGGVLREGGSGEVRGEERAPG
jgi:hypothetical protein